nr:uncharacterized protein LOC118682736 [Bactrocera oleae]
MLSRKYFLIGILIALLKYTPAQADTNSGNFDKINSAHNSNSSKFTDITTTKATENIAKNATTNKYNGNITTISSTIVSPKEEFKNFSVNVRQEQTASRANLSSNEEIIKRTTTLANITAIDVPTTNMVGADSSNNASSEAPLNDNLNDISRASMEISYPTIRTVMLIAAALHYLWHIRSDGYY